MQDTILDVVKGVEESGNQVTDKEEAFLYGGYDVEKQKKFSRRILEDMGFEFDRSSIGVVAHPFTRSAISQVLNKKEEPAAEKPSKKEKGEKPAVEAPKAEEAKEEKAEEPKAEEAAPAEEKA